MDKAVIYFHFHLYTDDRVESKDAFLEKIRDFSAENRVEIAQYSFWSSDKIDIYSTMGDNYREILSLPDFIFNRDIKVHDFEELLDVGFKNVLYVDADDMNLIEDLAELLKDHCEIDYTETDSKILSFHWMSLFFDHLFLYFGACFDPVFLLFGQPKNFICLSFMGLYGCSDLSRLKQAFF